MNREKQYSIAAGAGIALLFYWQISFVSFNTPFLDDVNFIDFVWTLADKPLPAFFRNLFMVDNNHMAVIPKIELALQYFLFHDINFQRILLISTLQIVAIAILLFRLFRNHPLSYWQALPLFFCWFQPQYFEISNWAMTGIQQSSVILFSLLALYFIEKPGTKNVLFATLFAGMAFYSFGSGVFAYVGIGYYLLVNHRFREILWVIPLPAIQLASYLYMAQLGSVMNTQTIHIENALAFFLNLLGTMSMVIQWHPAALAWGLGTCFFLLSAFALLKIDHRSSTATFLLMLLGNCLLIVLNRAGLGLGMVSRFAIISPLIACCLYLIYLPKLSKRMSAVLLLLAAGFWVASYAQYLPIMYKQKHDAEAEAANWDLNKRWLYPSNQFQDNAAHYLLPSHAQKLWQSENVILPANHLPALKRANILQLDVQIHDQIISIDHFPGEIGLKKAQFLIFYRDLPQEKVYIKYLAMRQNSKKNIMLGHSWLIPVSYLDLSQTSMESGTYQLYLFDAEKQQYWKTKYSFTRP